MPRNIDIRPASPKDAPLLNTFLTSAYYVHRHLDWRTPQDWLTAQPFLLLCEGKTILAALACPDDPPEINWIRLFASSHTINYDEAWKLLFNRILQSLATKQEKITFAAVVIKDWFSKILQNGNFQHYQDIVVLEWKSPSQHRTANLPGLSIRQMNESDLETVTIIDHLSFEPLWRNSYHGVAHSFALSAYATVASIDDQIVGYQISTQSPFNAHLARLAVLPNWQHKGIGSLLVNDLITHFIQQHIYQITVNTQSNNYASLALYQKLGFVRNQDSYPVYLLEFPKNSEI